MDTQRIENLLGALALALADEMQREVARSAGHGAAAPAALVSIGTTPELTIDQLRAILQLSHSGTVRLIDRLAASGLVQRHPGRDGRSVALSLTEDGEAAMQRVLEARQRLLARVLQSLSPAEQARLGDALGTLLAAVVRDREQGDYICRLCDESVCTTDSCPVEAAVTRPSRG